MVSWLIGSDIGIASDDRFQQHVVYYIIYMLRGMSMLSVQKNEKNLKNTIPGSAFSPPDHAMPLRKTGHTFILHFYTVSMDVKCI